MITRQLLPLHPLLGRHIEHDEQSKDFPYKAADGSKLRSIRHKSRIGVLDQGQTGACTGNAGTYLLSHPAYEHAMRIGHSEVPTLNEDFARDTLYHMATVVDGFDGTYPPTDTGSSGLAVAQVLKGWGYLRRYEHAFDTDNALDALVHHPVLCGVPWYQDMFDPDSDGFLTIDGDLAGGHEVCIDEINVEDQYVEFTNSWGSSWGLGGRARITWQDWDRLLQQQGDVTICLPAKS
jgi:hypothetical protein